MNGRIRCLGGDEERIGCSTTDSHVSRGLKRDIPVEAISISQETMLIHQTDQNFPMPREMLGTLFWKKVGKESWLSLSAEQTSLAPGEAPPDWERHTIQLPKFMLNIVWGITGFHVAKLLPKASTLNSSSYIDEIPSETAFWREVQGQNTNRRLVVHANNARPHTPGLRDGLSSPCSIILMCSDIFRWRTSVPAVTKRRTQKNVDWDHNSKIDRSVIIASAPSHFLPAQ
jgi:hypothetical protein